MATSYTSLLGLALPVTGELAGTWGDTVNNAITSLLDTAIAGTTTLSTDADVTLTTTTGASNQARQAILLCSGARTALRTITAPAQSKIYVVINNTTGGYGVKLVGVGPTTGVTVAAGKTAVLVWNGSDFVEVAPATATTATNLAGGAAGSVPYQTGAGATSFLSIGTANQVLQVNAGATAPEWVSSTGTGNVVRATSATLATPTITTSATVPLLIGGTGTTSTLSLRSTSGVGTTGADIIFQTGNNGATEAMRILNSGNVGIGTATPSNLLSVQGDANFTGNVTLGDATTDTVTVSGFMGLNGGSANSSVGVRVGGSLSNVAQRAFYTDFTGSSAATARVVGFETGIATADAAYTVPTLASFYANNVTKGAASTITNQHGVYVADQTNGNSNYGVTSIVSSGSNKWNIYASGTANNYFAGNVGIGTASPGSKLDVAGSFNVTGNAVLGDATTDTVTINGYVSIGGTPISSQGLRVIPNALTGTTQFGSTLSLIATSAATAGVEAARVQAGTAAAAFTTAYAAGLWVRDAILGSGSTITNNYGIFIDDKTVGTNNYGITLAVNSGSNKWNIYASGTADNAFAGNVRIGSTTAPTVALDVTGAINVTGNATLGDASTDTVTVNGFMGVGGAGSSIYGLNVSNTPTGTDPRGIRSAPTFSSSATTSGAAFVSAPSTQAAAFTITDIYHYRAGAVTVGASSSITNVHGIHIADQTTGTNNYGITSLISSGANKWNIYASGTANNYFAGNVGIGTTSVGNKLVVENNAASITNLQVNNTSSASGAYAQVRVDGDAGGGFFGYVGSGNVTTGIYETDYTYLASNLTSSGLNIGATATGGILRFYTNGVGVGSERMRIDSAGNVGVGVTPSAWSGYRALDISGRTSLAAGGSNEPNLVYNAYNDGTNWIYKASTSASYYQQIVGQHRWFTAAAGTAGNTVTFTQAMTLLASGGLSIGDTTDPGAGGLRVTGNTTLGDASTDTVTVNGYMGVGGAASSDIGFNLVNAALTGTTQYGAWISPTGTSGATANIIGAICRKSTAAAAFTATNAISLRVGDGSKGAGSTITNNYGIQVLDQSNGTNNYGITSEVSSGANKWNIYASGTADNYFSGAVRIYGAGGLGYGTGSGGAVTQATSRTTGVTLNKTNGAITLVSAAGTATWQTFTVTNSTVVATDVVKVCQKSGTDKYMIHVTAVAAGSFDITFATTGGTTTEQPVFNFAVIKAVTA